MAENQTKLEIKNQKQLNELEAKRFELKEERFNLENAIIDKRTKAYRDAIKLNKEEQRDVAKAISAEKKRGEILENVKESSKEAADKAKELGENIEEFVKGMPGGGFLVHALGLEGLGEKMQTMLINKIQQATLSTGALGTAMKLAMGPLGILVAAVTVLAGIAFKVFTHFRDVATELKTSVVQAAKLSTSIKGAQAQLVGTGQDAEDIAGELITTFGTLEKVNAANIRDIGLLSTRFGASTEKIVEFQKVFTDLTGQSLDASENVLRTIGKLAQAQGVAAGRVIEDIADNAAAFAEFSRAGADGLAEAAVQAAKIGSNLQTVLSIADNLLDFESSLTAEFEAQVLTGKQLNLERARQLSLEGDIEGLTREVQQTVGSLGEIQRLNVIERRSIASAIGVSVDELLKISRGEQIQERETVQQKIDVTNRLIAESNDNAKAYYENDLKKKGETGIGFGL